MAAMSLQAYSLGLIFMMLIKVLAPGYYARQDTKTPVKIGIIAMSANMIFNLILVWPLGHVGLALATSMSAALNAFLLWRGLHRDGVHRFASAWWGWLRILLVSASALLLWLWWVDRQSWQWLEWGDWQRVAYLLPIVATGVILYLGAAIVAGLRMRHLKAH
jgi:putative peptidoglycan lipid II flippase